MSRKKDNQPSKYKHDTLLLRTEQWEAVKDMKLEQKGKLLELIYLYAAAGDFKKTDDLYVNGVFSFIQSSLNTNWKKYQEETERRSFEATKKGIISQLKSGNTISKESVSFLKEHGLFNRKIMEKMDIPKESIDKLFALEQIHSYPADADAKDEGEKLPFD